MTYRLENLWFRYISSRIIRFPHWQCGDSFSSTPSNIVAAMSASPLRIVSICQTSSLISRCSSLLAFVCGRLHLGQSPVLVKEYSSAFEIHRITSSLLTQRYYFYLALF